MKHLARAVLILFLVGAAYSAEIPKPMPNTYIHDFAGVLPDGAKADLQAKAKNLKEDLNTEIAVVLIDSLNGEDRSTTRLRWRGSGA